MVASLVDRNPVVSPDALIDEMVPPPTFDEVSFDSYIPDPNEPTQSQAVDAARDFVARARKVRGGKRGLFSRNKQQQGVGLYLDGGFGVGKTHLLASIYHAMPEPKSFATFVEVTHLVGALGFMRAVERLSGHSVLCIDEFELDDPGDTMVMTRLIGELVPTGTKLAATSNTPPNALGEGRFAAQDFLREIHAMASSFETIRIDGTDYRQRAIDGHAVVLTDDAYAQALTDASAVGTASDDDFSGLIRHLASVHPSRYIRLIEGVGTIGLRGVAELDDQSAALRFVAFVDRAYDAQIPVRATGERLDGVFAPEMLAGGYRKKYLRAISRLNALTHS